jgi:hypothetical protein
MRSNFCGAGRRRASPWYLFALYCIAAWPLSVTHPLVGQRSQPAIAGRAIAFFNLLLFVGVFLWQWSFGVLVSKLVPMVGVETAYRLALGALAAFSLAGYLLFMTGAKRPGSEEVSK